MISFHSRFAEVDRIPQRARIFRNQAAAGVSDRGPDSVVAIETSGDWRLAATRAYPAFAPLVRYAFDGC
jgi:hypothetical protein